ncbi:MAG TPA: DoxX family membrane protein [Acetobacteraceae bacterium]|jgi:putative oxidoreductase|nr:DoxX family membrane protein [Acetobacteraceae bacterium]
MAGAFLVGRILAGGYFLMGALHHFTNTSQMAHYAALRGVPTPTAAVLLAGVLLLIGGLSLLLGAFPRIGVAALVLFLVPVTLVMHAFWADRDPMMRMNDVINFGKNVGLLGTVLMLAAVPRPWPYSVERRLRLPVRAPV